MAKSGSRTKPVRIRKGIHISGWMPTQIGLAFESLRKKTKMTKKTQLQDILEKALSDAGVWSPDDKA